MTRLILAVLAVMLIVSPAFAAKAFRGPAQPYVLDGGMHIWGTFVKQQSDDPACFDDGSCVVNPSKSGGDPCVWDIDDRAGYSGSGYLLAGTYSVTQCAFWDAAHHLTGVTFISPADDLTVTLAYEPAGITIPIAPVLIEPDLWRYRGCVIGPIYGTNDPVAATVPDSNGGWAASGGWTFTLVNPTDHHKKSSTQGGVLIGSSEPSRQSSYCVGEIEGVTTADGGVFRIAVQ